MKNFIKKIFGIDKLEEKERRLKEENIRLEKEKLAALEDAKKVAEEEANSKLTPKDKATRKKEPWVGVLNTHVNKDNVRNGFFELDWNEYFILQLKQEGYGVEGDTEEEIVDRWFRELCANVVVDGDYGGPLSSPINTGVVDIQSVKRNNK